VALVCMLCDGEVDDEADWDEESQICNACFEVSDGPSYCCGIMYDNGEHACRSCGEPL
jgi:hypothetical protein